MSVTSFSPMRTPWLGAIVALILIWSLYTLDLGSMKSTIVQSSTYQEIITSKPSANEINPASEKEGSIIMSKPSAESPAKSTTGQTVQVEGEDISKQTVEQNPERPLILYAYAETPNARANFEFFLAHGLHGAADFVFIINGESNATDLIPKEPNFRIIQRENDCYDMGAYSEILQKDDLYKKYKRFILLNASIRGPFSPYWANACWSDMYLGRLSEEIKLVGMTANCWPTFHVQSMILATDILGIETLLHPTPSTLAAYEANPPKSADDNVGPQVPGINSCFHTWGSAVKAEISITSLIKAAGYKVDVMMSAFHGMKDYESTCDPEEGDLLWDKEYYGINVHPFETVFMKSNRNIDPLALERHTEWQNERKYSSYDYCKA